MAAMATRQPGVRVRAHPPERRRAAPVTLNAGCCCCCCCCCLHTVGGLIGAAMGSSAAPASRPSWYDDSALAAFPAANPRSRSTDIQPGAGDVTAQPPAAEPTRPDFDEDVFDLRQPTRLSAAALFWYLSLSAGMVGLFLAMLTGDTGLLGGLLILAMVFPAVQLVAAVIVLFVFLFSTRSDRGAQLSQAGKITGGLVAGTLVGFGAMMLMCAGCR